jgi:hypothetical protein
MAPLCQPRSLARFDSDRYNAVPFAGIVMSLSTCIATGAFAKEWRMRRLNLLLILGGMLVGLVAATGLSLRAQGQGKQADRTVNLPTVVTEPRKESFAGSISDALVKPYHFRFGRPISLTEVAQRLSADLGSPVVLDLAALARLDLKSEDTVKLELQGVRLKTGLKLLLDQVGLTYRAVPEDNLLILTDKEGSEDPIDRVMSELRELHRDVHDIQDSLDEIRDLTGMPGAEGGRVRKPTIIEEVPEVQDQNPKPGTGPAPAPVPDPRAKPPRSPSPRPRTSL